MRYQQHNFVIRPLHYLETGKTHVLTPVLYSRQFLSTAGSCRFPLMEMLFTLNRFLSTDSINNLAHLKWTTGKYSYYTTGANPSDICRRCTV